MLQFIFSSEIFSNFLSILGHILHRHTRATLPIHRHARESRACIVGGMHVYIMYMYILVNYFFPGRMGKK